MHIRPRRGKHESYPSPLLASAVPLPPSRAALFFAFFSQVSVARDPGFVFQTAPRISKPEKKFDSKRKEESQIKSKPPTTNTPPCAPSPKPQPSTHMYIRLVMDSSACIFSPTTRMRFLKSFSLKSPVTPREWSDRVEVELNTSVEEEGVEV